MNIRVKHLQGDAWEVSLPTRCRAVKGMSLLRPRRVVHATSESDALVAGEKLLAREYPAYRLGAGMDTAELTLNFIERARKSKVYTQETAHDYELCIKRYVEPYFAIDADKACAADFEELYQYLLENGGANGDELDPNTIHKLNSILKAAYKWMCEQGVVDSSPIPLVQLPKSPHANKRALSEDESAALLGVLKELIEGGGMTEQDEIWRIYAFGAWTGWWTGARVGEVCGLLRLGVHFATERIEITGSVSERGTLHRKDPKTKAGSRNIAPGAVYMKSLKSYMDWCRKSWIDATTPITEFTPVFCTREGGFIRPSDMSQGFKEICKLARIDLKPGESFHTLRHTNATLLLSKGVNPEEARRRLGHAHATTTLENYGHAMPGEDYAAAASFADITERIMGGSVSDDMS